MFLPQKNNELIKDLLEKEESNQLDFKQNISNLEKIAKTLVAFANTQGGEIAIGISDQKKIIGIDPEEEYFMIKKSAENYCDPPISFDCNVIEIDYLNDEKLDEELYVLIITVPKSKEEHHVIYKDQRKVKYHRIEDKNIPESDSNLPSHD
ncbi:putative transcriptional regulator with HTH domain [Belliella baltica DSM 15883]|uniref:Putative transcriptional regulator with HTH domain n=1 Tax=Belliella baltica (strain DSM 15883 / CIP 108006 / LMG 21964 / BA134) TaxID=866536 RepID=I3Z8L1_BELBD|nr:ATP-binding protein [Belliella baltica]AFL85579.1 putative transcriptional regulator with HTH domain [Belliella baltica DSM 15883]